MFKSGQQEVDEAAHMFNEDIYGQRARKLKKQSRQRRYQQGELYTSQALYRDASLKNMPCQVAVPKIHDCMIYYRYIKLGDQMFKVAKVDGSQNHVYYQLTDEVQLEMRVAYG